MLHFTVLVYFELDMVCGKVKIVSFSVLLFIATCMGQTTVEVEPPPSSDTPSTPITPSTPTPSTPTTPPTTAPTTPTTLPTTAPTTPTTAPTTPTTPPTTPTTAPTTPTTPPTTTTAAPAVCTAAGKFPNLSDTTCKSYYRCTATLIRYDYICPGTAYFNTATATCTAVKPAGCV